MEKNDALDVCRQEFEDWYKQNFDNPQLFRDRNGYTDRHISISWYGWQAAWNTRSQPCGDAVKECEACGGSGGQLVTIGVAGCCGNGLPSGECCQMPIEVPEQMEVICEYCGGDGKSKTAITQALKALDDFNNSRAPDYVKDPDNIRAALTQAIRNAENEAGNECIPYEGWMWVKRQNGSMEHVKTAETLYKEKALETVYGTAPWKGNVDMVKSFEYLEEAAEVTDEAWEKVSSMIQKSNLPATNNHNVIEISEFDIFKGCKVTAKVPEGCEVVVEKKVIDDTRVFRIVRVEKEQTNNE